MSKSLRIVADANMPQVESLFSSVGEVVLKDGRTLVRQDLMQADVLLVRSVTRVTAALLEGSPVRFVGSATAGLDHIDDEVLHHPRVAFANAAGANARSVVEYDLAVLAYLYHEHGLRVHGATFGVIGYGNVGRRLCHQLSALGIALKVYDPLVDVPIPYRVDRLIELADVDVLCVHAPLTESGPYPTRHMLNSTFLNALPPHAVVISAGRGGIVDEVAMRQCLLASRLVYCADVWDGEPGVDRQLVSLSHLATPHIAGYSVDSKVAATRMLYDAMQWALFGRTADNLGMIEDNDKTILQVSQATPEAALMDAIYQVFPVIQDDARFRQSHAGDFDRLRANYWPRKEFKNFRLQLKGHDDLDAQKSLLQAAGFSCVL